MRFHAAAATAGHISRWLRPCPFVVTTAKGNERVRSRVLRSVAVGTTERSHRKGLSEGKRWTSPYPGESTILHGTIDV
jgi:hypothetical protein